MLRPTLLAAVVVAIVAIGSSGCARRSAQTNPTTDASAPVLASEARATVAEADATPRVWPVWTAKIANDEEFDHYSTVSGNERYLKLVVDLHTKATYYADADLYPMHKDFVFAEILKAPRTPQAVAAFDKNYGKDKPDFLMLYVVHHLKQDVWTLAYWEGDKATAAHTRLAFERLRATFHRAEQVKFRPCSNDQEAVAKELAGEIESVSNHALYKALSYQLFHPGVAVGKLRVVRGDPARVVFSAEDVVILSEPLTDLTPVAGILTESFSTPLSHVNLRAAAWDVPNAGMIGAAKAFAALEGRVVRYEATTLGASIRLATEDEVSAAAERTRRRTTVQVPKVNLDVKALATLDVLRATDAAAYGAKTANLGAIVAAAPAGVAVPPGFGIPIAHYAKHIEAAGVRARIEQLLVDPRFRASAAERRSELEKVRRQIQDAPLDPSLLTELQTALGKLGSAPSPERVEASGAGGDAGSAPGVFVRSSTNAEDLDGFSGAGLYDTVPNVRGAAAVAEAVKKVWASVWNLAAFEERELYKVDQRQVFGAVLVQVGVPATAAGVLVTAHPTDRSDKHTIQINAKSGLGMRVVDGKKLPEIVLYNTFNKGLRVVSRSDEDTMLVFSPTGGVREVANPKKGEPILTNARVQKLAAAALTLREVFPRGRPLDIEWVLAGEDLYIVQARPFMGSPR